MARTADVVIVGAGIMGLCTAYYLKQRGVERVTVLERSAVGAGSTGVSGSGIRHQFSDPVGIELTRRSVRVFEQFQDLFGAPLSIERCGYLYCIQTEQQLAAFRKNAELQRRLGLDVTILSPREIGERFPYLSTDDLLGGSYCPEDCAASPQAGLRGVEAKVRELGVEIATGVDVTGFDVAGDRLAGVQTPSGGYATEAALIATGAWAGETGRLAGVDIPVVPRRREQYFLDVPRSAVPATPYILDPRSGFGLRREGDVVVIGTTLDLPPTFDTTPNPEYGPTLRERVSARCAAVREAPISYSMAGLLEVTPDHNGIISTVSELPGLHVLAGFSGHGWMHAPAAGELMAEIITEGQSSSLDLSGFALDRFKAGVGHVDPTSPFGADHDRH
jgi:sarcosine oxidase subunit beta